MKQEEQVEKKEYIFEEVIKKKHIITDIARFLKYAIFCAARKKLQRTPTTCFECGHKFQPDEWTYIAMLKGELNQLFCETCANKIAKVLGKNEISKLSK